MTQTSPRFCPNCGTAVPAGQRFCSNCGSVISPNANSPTVSTDGNQRYGVNSSMQDPPAYGSTILSPDDQSHPQPGFPGASPYRSTPVTSGDPAYLQNSSGQSLPPPPPPESLMQAPAPVPYTPPYSSQSSSYYSSPTQQGTPVVPDYARVQKRSPLRRLMTLVSILVILALLVGGFLLLRPKSGSNNGNTTSNNANGQNTAVTGGNSTATSGQSGTATSGAPVTATESLNLMVTYASIGLTINSVQQASSFPDDSSATQGVVRVNLQEHNPTTQGANFLYSDVVRLVLPGGATIVAPDNEQNAIGPNASVSRSNWIDFPVTTQVDLSKLVLRLGTPTENQMDVLLAPNADLSKYQPKTVHPNVKAQYAGLTWTVTTAIASLSENAKQASAGMRFVEVTLSVDNPTSNDFNAYWGDYLRLQSGSVTNPPSTDTNFPLGFKAGSAGTTGSLIFLMPQDSTSFTLILLAQPNTSPPISQATAGFQIQ